MKRVIIVGLILSLVTIAFAQVKVDVAGKIYNQFRWTDGISDMGAHTEAPWNGGRMDPHKGNFMRSEVEFEINATVSRYVKTYLRMKTIFDADDDYAEGEVSAAAWQTYWDAKTGWFKLRGFRIDFMPPMQYVDVIQLGTPMGLRFSKWFMADRRYIDRDNAKGIYVQGNMGETWKWNLIRMWQPAWQGWDWNTGDFKTEDGTWALNVNTQFGHNFGLGFDAVWFIDKEFDPTDPDNPNFVSGDEDPDGMMSTKPMYQAYGFGMNTNYDLSDAVGIDLVAMLTGQTVDDSLDVNEDNIIDNFGGWEPVPKYASVTSPSFIFTLKTTDPFDMGLTPNLQFFYIHHNYVSFWGSRREDDMLMINGGVDGIRDTYGERLGLNTFLWGGGQNAVRHEFRDNENLRLGEGLYESPVGYWGGTLDFSHHLQAMTISGQFNYIGATNDTGGDTDKEDELYEGDGNMYLPARDFAGMVAGLGLKGKIAVMDWGLNFRYGNWIDGKDADDDNDDLETTAMVVELPLGRQLTNAMHLEVKPAYQQIVDSVGGEETTRDRIIISHKWVYNFGGFDFWLRGEHKFYSTDIDGDDDLSSNTLHAAFEVKF
jgi:hypothetical protein